MNRLPSRCPSCASVLEIEKLACPECGTRVEGYFPLCPFCRLDSEQRQLLEDFLSCRGNLRELQRLLGLSYPTVRNRLDAMFESLGLDVEDEDSSEGGMQILQRLDDGAISVDEAEQELKKAGRR